MKVVMISEKRLDELFDAMKSKLAEGPKNPNNNDEKYDYRTFVYYFEGLRNEVKNGSMGL